eukprot:14681-Chlamydomonas_euryale.AAC.1
MAAVTVGRWHRQLQARAPPPRRPRTPAAKPAAATKEAATPAVAPAVAARARGRTRSFVARLHPSVRRATPLRGCRRGRCRMARRCAAMAAAAAHRQALPPAMPTSGWL